MKYITPITPEFRKENDAKTKAGSFWKMFHSKQYAFQDKTATGAMLDQLDELIKEKLSRGDAKKMVKIAARLLYLQGKAQDPEKVSAYNPPEIPLHIALKAFIVLTGRLKVLEGDEGKSAQARQQEVLLARKVAQQLILMIKNEGYGKMFVISSEGELNGAFGKMIRAGYAEPKHEENEEWDVSSYLEQVRQQDKKEKGHTAFSVKDHVHADAKDQIRLMTHIVREVLDGLGTKEPAAVEAQVDTEEQGAKERKALLKEISEMKNSKNPVDVQMAKDMEKWLAVSENIGTGNSPPDRTNGVPKDQGPDQEKNSSHLQTIMDRYDQPK